MSQNPQEIVIKTSIFGDICSGKTSIVERYINDSRPTRYRNGPLVQMYEKIIEKENWEISFKIWDTNGSPGNKPMLRQYYSGLDGIFLVYDILNKESFINMQEWYREIKENKKDIENLVLVLIGNKCDKEKERKVEYSEGEDFAEKNNMHFVEVSCETNKNINECFEYLINECIIRKAISENEDKNETVEEPTNKKKNKKECIIF